MSGVSVQLRLEGGETNVEKKKEDYSNDLFLEGWMSYSRLLTLPPAPLHQSAVAAVGGSIGRPPVRSPVFLVFSLVVLLLYISKAAYLPLRACLRFRELLLQRLGYSSSSLDVGVPEPAPNCLTTVVFVFFAFLHIQCFRRFDRLYLEGPFFGSPGSGLTQTTRDRQVSCPFSLQGAPGAPSDQLFDLLQTFRTLSILVGAPALLVSKQLSLRGLLQQLATDGRLENTCLYTSSQSFFASCTQQLQLRGAAMGHLPNGPAALQQMLLQQQQQLQYAQSQRAPIGVSLDGGYHQVPQQSTHEIGAVGFGGGARGQGSSSPSVGTRIFLQSYGAKWLLVGSLLCLSSSLFFFSSADSLMLMYFTRFITGLCQAVPVVYFPVWVDDFAPEGQVTRWMSYTQLAGIGGTVGGYFFGGVFSRFTGPSGESKWRTPFFVQSVALIPVVLLLAALPASLVNLPDRSQPRPERQRTGLSTIGDADTVGQSCMQNFSAALIEVKSLLRNPLYVVVTLGMSALYFVVTGIQFWVTEFLVSVLHFQKLSVVALSTFCFLTAPTSGVWFGGYVCDLCGGYRGGGQQRVAVRVTTLFAAALVPVAVGIQLASVPFHQRSISSALSQFAYNMFGWFSAPLVSGVVMDFIDWCHPAGGKELALRFGFEMILWVTLVGFVLFAVANTLTFPSEDIEKEELELQLARTRMPTLSF
ncbi:hypothetical protein Emed_007386 [Eimeria media]